VRPKAWGDRGECGGAHHGKKEDGDGAETVNREEWRTAEHWTVPQRRMSDCTHELTRKGAWQLAYGSEKMIGSQIAVAGQRWYFPSSADSSGPALRLHATVLVGRKETAAAGCGDEVTLSYMESKARTLPPYRVSGCGGDGGCSSVRSGRERREDGEGADRWDRLVSGSSKETGVGGSGCGRDGPTQEGGGRRGHARGPRGRENGHRPTGPLGPKGGKEGENKVFSFLFL
jgi:hypothetical protein